MLPIGNCLGFIFVHLPLDILANPEFFYDFNIISRRTPHVTRVFPVHDVFHCVLASSPSVGTLSTQKRSSSAFISTSYVSINQVSLTCYQLLSFKDPVCGMPANTVTAPMVIEVEAIEMANSLFMS